MPILYMRGKKMKVNYQIGCEMWGAKTKKIEMTRKNPIPFNVRKQQRKTPF